MVPSTCIIDLFDLTTTINCLDEEDDGSQDMVNVTVNFPEFDKISQSNPVCDEKKNVYNGSKILHASNDDDTTTQEQPSTDDLGKNATTTRRKSVFNRVAASLKRNFKGSKQQDIRSYDVVGLNTSSRINSVTNEISLNKNDDHDERRSLRKKLDYEHLWETETDQEMVMSEFHKIILEGLSGCVSHNQDLHARPRSVSFGGRILTRGARTDWMSKELTKQEDVPQNIAMTRDRGMTVSHKSSRPHPVATKSSIMSEESDYSKIQVANISTFHQCIRKSLKEQYKETKEQGNSDLTARITLSLPLTQIECRDLGQEISFCSFLGTVSLTNCNLTSFHARYIFDAIANHPTYVNAHVILNLCKPYLTSKTITYQISVSVLFLDHNKLYDDGAEALADTIRQNTTLQHLSVASNRIKIKGALALMRATRLVFGFGEYNLSLQTQSECVAFDCGNDYIIAITHEIFNPLSVSNNPFPKKKFRMAMEKAGHSEAVFTY
eukprot:gene4800-97_t